MIGHNTPRLIYLTQILQEMQWFVSSRIPNTKDADPVISVLQRLYLQSC